jgi:hypothetical protein
MGPDRACPAPTVRFFGAPHDYWPQNIPQHGAVVIPQPMKKEIV